MIYIYEDDMYVANNFVGVTVYNNNKPLTRHKIYDTFKDFVHNENICGRNLTLFRSIPLEYFDMLGSFDSLTIDTDTNEVVRLPTLNVNTLRISSPVILSDETIRCPNVSVSKKNLILNEYYQPIRLTLECVESLILYTNQPFTIHDFYPDSRVELYGTKNLFDAIIYNASKNHNVILRSMKKNITMEEFVKDHVSRRNPVKSAKK